MKPPVPQPVARPKAKAPARSPSKAAKARANFAKAAVVAASATFVTAKLVDIALIGSGVAVAAGSAVFAGAMFMQGDHAPRINGMEYLAIFAQPGGTVKPVPEETEVASESPGIDLTPIGAISPQAATAGTDYMLVSARTDRAWVRDGSRIFAVHPGDVLPNLGKVAEILWTDDRWVIVGDNGRPLLMTGDASTAANPKKASDKRLILDGGNP